MIQHAGPGEEYEVAVSAKDCQCAIEVVNTNGDAGALAVIPGEPPDAQALDGSGLVDDPVSATAEHGRGLKIIDAVADNLQLTGDKARGTTVHFEKTLEWLPGAAGRHLLNLGDGASVLAVCQTDRENGRRKVNDGRRRG